jgi:hypothetical protein
MNTDCSDDWQAPPIIPIYQNLCGQQHTVLTSPRSSVFICVHLWLIIPTPDV